MDLTQCDASWVIRWNCNCTGKSGAIAVTITIGTNDPIQGCYFPNDAGTGVILCIPCASTGANGDPVTVVDGVPETHTGVLLKDGTDAVFCEKDVVISGGGGG